MSAGLFKFCIGSEVGANKQHRALWRTVAPITYNHLPFQRNTLRLCKFAQDTLVDWVHGDSLADAHVRAAIGLRTGVAAGQVCRLWCLCISVTNVPPQSPFDFCGALHISPGLFHF